jgi:secreted trypsin-like serine protease
MKNTFILTVILLVASVSNALDPEIINGVEGDMNGTGPHMVSISLMTEVYENGLFLQYHRSCSATLISKNVVITAAHCFGMTPAEISSVASVTIYFTLNKNVTANDFFVSKKFKVHADFNTITDYLNNDIALIYFKGDLPKGYKPADYLKTDDQFLLGQEFRAAGYGLRYDHNNPLASKATAVGKLMSTKLTFDSSYPNQNLFVTHISAQQTSTGICTGDSGGGAFTKNVKQQFKLVGINSSTGTSQSCLDGKSYYTRVSLFSEWISEAMKELSL